MKDERTYRAAWIGRGGLILFVLLLALGTMFYTQSVLLFAGMLGIVLSIVVLIVAGPLINWLSKPWGSLFYPGEYAAQAPPMYDTAAAQVKRGHYAEAMALYEKIIRDYPDEVQAYIGIIDLAIVQLNDPALAAYIYQRGLAVLKKPEARDTLTRMYAGIRSRREAKPEWQQPHSISMEGHPLNPFPDDTSDRDVPSAPR